MSKTHLHPEFIRYARLGFTKTTAGIMENILKHENILLTFTSPRGRQLGKYRRGLLGRNIRRIHLRLISQFRHPSVSHVDNATPHTTIFLE